MEVIDLLLSRNLNELEVKEKIDAAVSRSLFIKGFIIFI